MQSIHTSACFASLGLHWRASVLISHGHVVQVSTIEASLSSSFDASLRTNVRLAEAVLGLPEWRLAHGLDSYARTAPTGLPGARWVSLSAALDQVADRSARVASAAACAIALLETSEDTSAAAGREDYDPGTKLFRSDRVGLA